MALASSGNDREKYTQELFTRYPQLLPFGDLTMSFRLQVQGSLSNEQAKILEELRRSRINFTENQNAPIVALSFTKRGEAFDVNYSVQAGAQPIKGSFRVDTNELAGAGKI